MKNNGDRHNRLVKDIAEERRERALERSVPKGPTPIEREKGRPCYALMGFDPLHDAYRDHGLR